MCPVSYNSSVSSIRPSELSQSAEVAKGGEQVVGMGSSEGDTVQASRMLAENPLSFGGDGDPSNEAAANLSHLKAESHAHDKKTKRTARDKHGTKVSEKDKAQGAQGSQKVGGKDEAEQASRRQLSRFDAERFQKTTQERAGKLFPESLPKYQEGVRTLDKLPLGANEEDALKVAQSLLPDVAEEHNLLVTAKTVWEDELTLLQGGELKGTNARGEQTSQPVFGKLNSVKQQLSTLVGDDEGTQSKREKLKQEQGEIEDRIKELKGKIAMANQAIGKLMDVHGARIEDTYNMAPQIREQIALSPSSTTGEIRPAKDLAQVILDEILPLKGDRQAIFNVLINSLVGENFSKQN